jgi:rubrerythrin
MDSVMSARLDGALRSGAAPLYERHADAAERGAWAVLSVIDWNAVRPELARRTPAVLAAVREAALIESFHPVNLARLMRAAHDDIDAGVCFSIEAYEGFKHFHALRTYLDTIGYEPAITEPELVALRAGASLAEPGAEELIVRLVEFMLSEHLAAHFFRRLSEQAEEPQLARLLRVIAADEVRHAQSASDLIAKRIRADRSIVPHVLDAAVEFRHFGEEPLGHAVPVAMHGDPLAIRTFARRIERLCGVRIVDHLKSSL